MSTPHNFIVGCQKPQPDREGEAKTAIDNGTVSDQYEGEVFALRPSTGATAAVTATAAGSDTAAPASLEGYGGNTAGTAIAAAALSASLAPGMVATAEPLSHAAADGTPGGAQAPVLATGGPSSPKAVALGGMAATNEFPGSVVWATRDGGERRFSVIGLADVFVKVLPFPLASVRKCFCGVVQSRMRWLLVKSQVC